jgi:F5/8 type C domain
MPITEDQVKFYLSGGSTNSDVFASIGGPISTITQIRQDEFNNLWGDIGALDLKIGSVQYRAVYMKNESNNTVFENPRAYFAIKDAYVSIQFTKLGVNKRMALLPNERTAPPNAEVGPGGQIPATRHTYPSANVTVNSYIPPNAPGNANDQNTTTGWITGSAPAWLRVDLGAAKNIDYFGLRWVRNTVNACDNTFNIETSTDGTNWNSRFSGVHHLTAISQGPNTTNIVPVTPHSARYVRVNITATTNPIGEVGITEFEVWGVPDVAPTIEPTAVPETVSRILYPSENVTASSSGTGSGGGTSSGGGIPAGWYWPTASPACGHGDYNSPNYINIDPDAVEPTKWSINCYRAPDFNFQEYGPFPVRANADAYKTYLQTCETPNIGGGGGGGGSLDWSPANANDQNTQTAWMADKAPAWLAVNLGATKYLHYVVLRWLRNTVNASNTTFSVETSSDGASWNSVFSGTHHITATTEGPNVNNVVSFTRHNARHVRISIASSTNPIGEVGIVELEVWGVSEVLAVDIGGWEGATEDLATTQAAAPHIPPLSYIGLWLRREIPPNDLAFPTLKQTMKLEVVGGGGALPPSAPPVEEPPVEEPPVEEPPPTGGGTGTGPYPSTGRSLGATTRRATRHYASGKADDETIEKNTHDIPYQHYQCVYYVTMHGIEHDDNVSSKLGGTHMGSGWMDHGVSFNSGKCCLGTEPNHPDTNACIKTGPNIGSIIEKRIGIATIWRKATNHTELWTRLPGANWVKQLSNTGPLGGFTPDNDDDDEAQLRIDGFEDGDDPTIDVATVQEIAPA